MVCAHYSNDYSLLSFQHNMPDCRFSCRNSNRSVKGLYAWCQGCGHGGHLAHLRDWFSRNTQCPAGCGHKCDFGSGQVHSATSDSASIRAPSSVTADA